MAHKGYTIPYFIKYFSNIPDHQWCEGDLQRFDDNERGTVQHCALGHARRDSRTTLEATKQEATDRVKALVRIFGTEDNVVDVNDAGWHRGFAELGKTPRGRILKALRNIQRTGNILGNKNTDSDNF